MDLDGPFSSSRTVCLPGRVYAPTPLHFANGMGHIFGKHMGVGQVTYEITICVGYTGVINIQLYQLFQGLGTRRLTHNRIPSSIAYCSLPQASREAVCAE